MRTRCISNVVLATLAFAGCQRFSPEYLERGVQDGLQKIPAAKQFDEIFGKENVNHFVSYSGPNVANDWSSEVFFGGRYCLTMQVEVQMSYHFDKVLKVVGEPKFYFVEYKSIQKSPSGQIGAKTNQNPAIPYPFGAAMWRRIYEANGDMTVLNESIDVKQEPLPGFSEFVAASRAPIQKIER